MFINTHSIAGDNLRNLTTSPGDLLWSRIPEGTITALLKQNFVADLQAEHNHNSEHYSPTEESLRFSWNVVYYAAG